MIFDQSRSDSFSLLSGKSSLGLVALDGLGSGRKAGESLATDLLGTTEHGAGTLEVLVDWAVEQGLFGVNVNVTGFVGVLAGHASLPLRTVILELLLVVDLRVVVLANTTHALPDRQVLRVNSDSVVVVLTSVTDVPPAALLLLKIETSGIGEEEEGGEHTSKTEPRPDLEAQFNGSVVGNDGSDQSTELTRSSRETVSGGTDRSRETFGSNQESDTVGTELVEEGRQEVHSLERLDVGGLKVVLVVESGNDEENKAEQETNLLHPLTTVEFVVNEEGSQVVTAEGNTGIEQVVKPAGHQGSLVGENNADELRLEKLVAVEEDVIGEPTEGSGDETRPEVLQCKTKRLHIVTGNGGLLFDGLELLRGGFHVVGTEVNEPQGTDSRDGERDTVSPLSGNLGVGIVAGTVVENEQ